MQPSPPPGPHRSGMAASSSADGTPRDGPGAPAPGAADGAHPVQAGTVQATPPPSENAGRALCDNLQAWMDEAPGAEQLPLDCVEVFAGAQAITQAVLQFQGTAFAMDLNMGPTCDVLTPAGLIRLLFAVLRLRPGGLLWGAPPCSTWAWVSRGSTGRVDRVEGNWNRSERILGQNALVERLGLVLRLMRGQDVHWVIENPRQSIIWDYPGMAAAKAAYRDQVRTVTCELGAYGADTPKPVTLVGTAPWLGTFDRVKCSRARLAEIKAKGIKTAHVYYDTRGIKRVQGSKALKATQEYPSRFGRAVARAHLDALQDVQIALDTHAPGPTGHAVVDWGEGYVADLFRALPAEYQVGLRDAWWLADFNGRVWLHGYGDEAAVRAGAKKARPKAKHTAKKEAKKAKAKGKAKPATPARSSSTGSSSSRSGSSSGSGSSARS